MKTVGAFSIGALVAASSHAQFTRTTWVVKHNNADLWAVNSYAVAAGLAKSVKGSVVVERKGT